MIADLRAKIIDEIIAAFGFSRHGWARKFLGPLFWLPANHFAKLVSHIDAVAEKQGLPSAAEEMLTFFVRDIHTEGKENLPLNGPLLIASNHPGAYDILAVLSNISRQDTKIVVSDVALIQSLPALDRHMIYTPAGIGPRMTAVRKLIRHLQEGGTGLIFPSGKVDPDPAISSEGEERLAAWSGSLDLILKIVPDTKLSISIVSGVIAPEFLKNPLIRIIEEPWRQQKLAEILQVIQQLIFKRKFKSIPRITFGNPIDRQDLREIYPENEIQDAILKEARSVYHRHILR